MPNPTEQSDRLTHRLCVDDRIFAVDPTNPNRIEVLAVSIENSEDFARRYLPSGGRPGWRLASYRLGASTWIFTVDLGVRTGEVPPINGPRLIMRTGS